MIGYIRTSSWAATNDPTVTASTTYVVIIRDDESTDNSHSYADRPELDIDRVKLEPPEDPEPIEYEAPPRLGQAPFDPVGKFHLPGLIVGRSARAPPAKTFGDPARRHSPEGARAFETSTGVRAMAENSKIEWTDHTFNPWIGCTKVHEGCANCYAETLMDERYGKVQWGPNVTLVKTSPANWKKPLAWNCAAEKAGQRARVFCASLADVFEDWPGAIHSSGSAPVFLGKDGRASRGAESRMTMDDLRHDLFALIDATPWLDWLILTKRPENIRSMIPPFVPEGTVVADFGMLETRHNLWLGTSISLQRHAAAQIPELLKCCNLAPVLFLSIEPMLGAMRLRTGIYATCAEGDESYGTSLDGIGWVIVGGESGPQARPCEVQWVRDIRDQCRAAGVPCFVKQLGANCRDTVNPGDGDVSSRVRLVDRKGGDWNEWPDDLRVREFPEVAHA